jgi:hypothetical protein
LVHLVEDLDTSLVVADNSDRGGNDAQIRFFERGSNAHRRLGEATINRNGAAEEFRLDRFAALDSERNRSPWMGGPVGSGDRELADGSRGGPDVR